MKSFYKIIAMIALFTGWLLIMPELQSLNTIHDWTYAGIGSFFWLFIIWAAIDYLKSEKL